MADVELVIKVPEKWLKDMKQEEFCKVDALCQKILNGTPLPKGHDRLIDAKEYENSIRKHYFDNRTVIRCTEIALYSAETIVEADKN